METPYVLIDLSALCHNAKELSRRAGELYCVLKCDAYGHGAIKCAERLYDIGARRFAVYSLSEAIKIQPYAPNAEILILGRTEPCLLSEVETRGFVQTVGSLEYAEQIAKKYENLKIHIEIDCGMHRSGLDYSDISRAVSLILRENILGVFAHLSCADAEDTSVTQLQKARFEAAAVALESALEKPITRHLCASAGALRSVSDGNTLSRVGLALYGIAPDNCDGSFLRPVMSFHSQITNVTAVKKGDFVGYGSAFKAQKDMVIATVSGGYANGIPRRAAGKLTVSIGGENARSFGSICMDRFTVDVTPILEKGLSVSPCDTVTLFSSDLPISDMALACDTIPYELITLIGNNNRRIYWEGK